MPGLAPTLPPPPRLREVADEMAAYVSVKSEPPTETYAPFATRGEFAALALRVAALEHATGDTGSALELLRAENLAGVEGIKAQVRGLKVVYEADNEQLREVITDVAKQSHETKHAVRNMEQHRVAYAQYQKDTNQLFAAEHNKTRRIARAGNVAKALVGFALVVVASHFERIVTLLAHLVPGAR